MTCSPAELEIFGFAFGGRAVGRRPDGKVCFVRGAIPGEKIRVSLTADKKNYAEGVIDQILQASPDRIVSECPNHCPGCSYSHVPYPVELYWKEQQFRSFAEKAGLQSNPEHFLRPAYGAELRTQWRNKIRLSLEWNTEKEVTAGYRAEDNRTLIPVTDCPLAVAPIREILKDGSWKKKLKGEEKTVTFRYTPTDGVRVFFDREADGTLQEELSGFGKFEVGTGSFFQINSFMSGKLAELVLQMINRISCHYLIELYCGCGCFSILAAERFPELRTFGVELDKQAVRLAKENAVQHGVAKRCEFAAGDSAAVFRRKFSKGVPAGSLLLVDPPRTGLNESVRKMISNSHADSLLYISCGPDTLFRDLAVLEKNSWRITESRLVDMFPSTAHFESVTLCERIRKK